jgi:LSD1 subclass zinc finger protein
MPQLDTLTCPSCTASLDYDGRSETIRCSFCGTTIIVPESLKDPSATPGIMGDEDPSRSASIHEILRLAKRGRKLEAIKLYRETFGVGLKEAKEAVEKIERGDPTPIMATTAATVTATTAASSGCGCLLPMLILVLIAVGVFVFYMESPDRFNRTLDSLVEGDVSQVVEEVGDGLGNKAIYNEPILLADHGDGIRPDLLLETWTYGGDEIPVNLADTTYADDRRQFLWEVDLGNSGEHQYNIGFDDQRVYISKGSALQAYDRDSGEALWETVLSDEVRNTCRVCIRGMKDRVIVLTADNTLEAFDTNTGRSAWQVRLTNEYFAYPDAGQLAFTLVGDMVGILDEVALEEGPTETAVFFYDVDTGEEVRQLTPHCADLDNFFDDDTIDYDTQLFIDETSGEMVVLFGTPAYVQQMCLQKWNANSGELLLDARVPGHLTHSSNVDGGMISTSGRFPFAAISPDTLLTTLEIESENGRSTGIAKFDLNTGELLFQHADEDYDLAAIGQINNVILAWAERTRGTSQFEIWGVDEATGEQLWKHILQAEYLFELDPFDDKFSYHLQPDGLVVLQLLTDPDPPELLVEKLNPADGSLVYETTTSMSGDSWRGLVWADDYAYLTMSNLVAVDLETGEAEIEWP